MDVHDHSADSTIISSRAQNTNYSYVIRYVDSYIANYVIGTYTVTSTVTLKVTYIHIYSK